MENPLSTVADISFGILIGLPGGGPWELLRNC